MLRLFSINFSHNSQYVKILSTKGKSIKNIPVFYFLMFRLKYYFLPEPQEQTDSRFRRKGKNKNDGVAPDYRKQLFSMVAQKEIFSKLSYYHSLVWLIDYSFVSLIVFTLCQIFVYLFPKDNATNVSVLWTIFSMTFGFQVCYKIVI